MSPKLQEELLQRVARLPKEEQQRDGREKRDGHRSSESTASPSSEFRVLGSHSELLPPRLPTRNSELPSAQHSAHSTSSHLCVMPVRVSQPSGAKTDEREETTSEQDAGCRQQH